MGFMNAGNPIFGLPVFATIFDQSHCGQTTQNTIVTFLPVTSYRPEAMRVTERASAAKTWCEVDVTDRRYGAIPGSAYWRHLMIGA